MTIIPEIVAKFLDTIAKYAWAVTAVCALVLFLPNKSIDAMGLTVIRQEYLGFWWIGFIFSSVIAFSSTVNRLSKWLWQLYMANKRRRKILGRIVSLNQWERKWIAYCLLYNTQTLTAQLNDPIANSLLSKGLIERGSGSVLNLPYHMRDFVWQYVQQHRNSFLTGEQATDPQTIQALEEFAVRIKRPF